MTIPNKGGHISVGDNATILIWKNGYYDSLNYGANVTITDLRNTNTITDITSPIEHNDTFSPVSRALADKLASTTLYHLGINAYDKMIEDKTPYTTLVRIGTSHVLVQYDPSEGVFSISHDLVAIASFIKQNASQEAQDACMSTVSGTFFMPEAEASADSSDLLDHQNADISSAAGKRTRNRVQNAEQDADGDVQDNDNADQSKDVEDNEDLNTEQNVEQNTESNVENAGQNEE